MALPSTRLCVANALARPRSRSLSPPRQRQRIQHVQGRLMATAVSRRASPEGVLLSQWMHLWLYQADQLNESSRPTSSSRLPRKCFCIEYSDEQLQQKQASRVPQLIRTLQDSSATSSRNALLAKKALRYRRVLSADGFANDDFGDHQLDVSRYNSIRWVCRHQQQQQHQHQHQRRQETNLLEH